MKKPIKTLIALVFTLTVAFSFAGCTKDSTDTSQSVTDQDGGDVPDETDTVDEYRIGIIQLVEHDALDASARGFKDALKDNGIIEGENLILDEQNAQNDQSNLKTISQRFAQNDLDLVLAIATPALQSVATEIDDIPVLGTAVTDYISTNLVDTNEKPGRNVSGTTDLTPVSEQIKLFVEMYPDAKTIGVLYNSSEVNSEIQAKMAEETIEALGLECEFGTVTSTNDIAQVVQSIASKVDGIYIPTDNTFSSAITITTDIANENNIPTIVGEVGMCKGGALATMGIDYYKLGYQTGEMAVEILKNGADPASMPIEQLNDNDLCINLDTAKEIGYEVPQSIIDRAVYTIEDGVFLKDGVEVVE